METTWHEDYTPDRGVRLTPPPDNCAAASIRMPSSLCRLQRGVTKPATDVRKREEPEHRCSGSSCAMSRGYGALAVPTARSGERLEGSACRPVRRAATCARSYAGSGSRAAHRRRPPARPRPAPTVRGLLTKATDRSACAAADQSPFARALPWPRPAGGRRPREAFSRTGGALAAPSGHPRRLPASSAGRSAHPRDPLLPGRPFRTPPRTPPGSRSPRGVERGRKRPRGCFRKPRGRLPSRRSPRDRAR